MLNQSMTNAIASLPDAPAADAIAGLRESGWLGGIERIPSPNCDARPDGSTIDLLVVHNISLPPGQYGGPAVVDLFTNRLDPKAHPFFATIEGLRVSAHLLLRRDG